MIKSKLISSFESIRKFFSFGSWNRVPLAVRNCDDEFDFECGYGRGGERGFEDEDHFNFIESDSLICSYQSLPTISSSSSTTPSSNGSRQHVRQYQSKNQMKRIVKELIDDEVPLINL